MTGREIEKNDLSQSISVLCEEKKKNRAQNKGYYHRSINICVLIPRMHMRHVHDPCPHAPCQYLRLIFAHAHTPTYTPSDPGPDFGIQKKTRFVGHAKAVIAPACVAKQTRIQTSNGQLLTLTLRVWLLCPAIGTFTESGLMHVLFFSFLFFFCSALGCRCGVSVLTPASTAVRRVKDRGQRAPPPPLRTLLSHISFKLNADFCWAFMWLGRIAAAEGWRSLLSLVWFVRWFLAEEANQASDLIFRPWWVSFCPIEQRMRGVRGWGHPV